MKITNAMNMAGWAIKTTQTHGLNSQFDFAYDIDRWGTSFLVLWFTVNAWYGNQLLSFFKSTIDDDEEEWWKVFAELLTKGGRRSALFWDSHHHKSPTHCEQNLNLCIWSCSFVLLTTTPQCHRLVCDICSDLTIMTQERCLSRCFPCWCWTGKYRLATHLGKFLLPHIWKK